MNLLRRDPATGRWVIFTPGDASGSERTELCPFCGGNESLTPPEIIAWGNRARAPNAPGWSVRVVPSLDPQLRIEGPLERRAEGMYDWVSATGAHEVVVETPEHRDSLALLPSKQVGGVLRAYAQRIGDLKRDSRFRSIFIFKNQGAHAGATLIGHAHSQIVALPVTPKALKEILQGARSHFEIHERCVFCDILAEELARGLRIVEATERFVAFVPYAARHPYETWILPRSHAADMESTSGAELDNLADLLVAVLRGLERVLPDRAYNLFLYSGPNRTAHPDRWKTLEEDFHWHIQILPRLRREAGFEVGSGLYRSTLMPEDAAAALRAALIGDPHAIQQGGTEGRD